MNAQPKPPNTRPRTASAKPGDLVMIQADTADETVAHLKDQHGAE